MVEKRGEKKALGISGVKFYKPEKKVKVSSEEAFPYLIDVGSRVATLGGLTGFFISSFIASFKTFRDAKKKVREFEAKHRKTLDLS